MPRQQLIQLRKGSGAPSAAAFAEGEPAWDSQNGRLYVKNAAGQMVQVGAGSGGGQQFTASTTAPASPADGDEWLDLSTGVHYVRVNDGNSTAWVELTPPQLLAPAPATNLDGGTPSTVFGGIAPIDAGGVS